MTNHSIQRNQIDVIAFETKHQEEQERSQSASNLYTLNPNYLPNPADPLYQLENVSESDHVQNLVEEAARLESLIAADFDLDELTDKFKINTLGYVKNGLIAFKIKSLRLYKQSCRTFKQFCQEHLGLSTWQVNRNIRAAKVVMELIAHGFDILPRCEAQCRALLAHCEENLVSAWRSIIENLPTHQITAHSITLHLCPERDETMPNSERITVNRDLFNRIYTVALSVGTTIPELLERIFQPKLDNCANHYYEEKVRQWQDDLSNLVNSREIFIE